MRTTAPRSSRIDRNIPSPLPLSLRLPVVGVPLLPLFDALVLLSYVVVLPGFLRFGAFALQALAVSFPLPLPLAPPFPLLNAALLPPTIPPCASFALTFAPPPRSSRRSQFLARAYSV